MTASPGRTDHETKLRARSLLLGALLIPLVTLWVAATDNIYGGSPTYLSIFFHAVILLAALMAVNGLLRLIGPRYAFTRAEMLLIYMMIGVSSGVVGSQFMAILVPSLAHPFRYATDANHWADKLLPYLPMDAMVSDPVALRNFYEGGSTLYSLANLVPWLRPGLLWAGFIAVTQLMCLAINLLIRQQWTQYEKLSFPLVVLPMEMTAGGPASMWRSKLMWLGFGISALIDLCNGLKTYWPAIPYIPVKFRYLDFSGRWSAALMATGVSLYPFLIGIAFLLPMDLTFSTWFFLLFFKFQRLVCAGLGYPSPEPWASAGHSTPPAMVEQGTGGYLAVVVFGLWAARRHLAAVWTAIWRGSTTEQQGAARVAPAEVGEYRLAAGFLAVGLVLTTAFAVSLGMPVCTGFLYILFYLVINIAIAKIRAEAGAPTHGFHFAGPDQILLTAIGANKMQVREMAAWGLFFGFNRGYTGVPMPHQLEGLKMGELAGARHQSVATAAGIATVLGCFAAVWALLHLCFREGVEQMGGSVRLGSPQGWQLVNMWLTNAEGPNWGGLAGIAVGFLFASFLMAMRFRFVWWQFHPIGYAIGPDWTTGVIWVPLMIGWAWKTLMLRYTGPCLYKAAVPLALGLMLGEFAVGGFWSLLAMLTRKPQYSFWP